jgi:hypothetical protein
VRWSLAATLERTFLIRRRAHLLTLTSGLAAQQLTGAVSENDVLIEDAAGRPVRRVEFGPAGSLGASDHPLGVAARDVWEATDRLQVDAGVRVDHDTSYGGPTPSARAGIRYELNERGSTVLKAGYGRFVGSLPLAVESFFGYPTRTDVRLDPETGTVRTTTVLRPAVDRLQLPRATAATVQIEREIGQGLDTLVGVTVRRSSRLATLDVPAASGPLAVRSTGTGSYRELQFSIRKRWRDNQQLFASYVRSSARGELNDFAALFQQLDAPLLQPGGASRLPADATHRWIVWGTINMPYSVVVSPVVEWHSGFPYSLVDASYLYDGEPNRGTFPAFLAADFIVYRTFRARGRAADLGIQLFNATGHFNPRDVNPVTTAPGFGRFSNGVGPVLRGFMLLKW